MQNNLIQIKNISLVKSFWFLIVTMLLGLSQVDTMEAETLGIQFMASETSWTDGEFVGHAFICLSVYLNSGIKEDCFGFYPREGEKKPFIGGPGVVKSEFQKNPNRFSRISVSFTTPISYVQRGQIIGMIDEWNSKNYDLTNQSCIDFVNSIAKALNLITPTRSATDLPVTYLRNLSNVNPLSNDNPLSTPNLSLK